MMKNNNKWSYAHIVLYIIFSFINILVCINILSFDAWLLGLIVTSLVNSIMVLSLKKKSIQPKERKMVIIGWSTLLIWSVTLVTAFFIRK